VHDPDLLFLDEPTNGMDPQGRQAMLTLIADLGRAGISVLLSSHLLPDVERVCDRVVIMGAGQMLAGGRIEEMKEPHPTQHTIDYVGEGDLFRRRLAEQGVTVRSDSEGVLAIDLPEAGRQDLVLRAAAESGAKVRGLRPKRSSLEERFMAAIRRQEHG
jgi:ABC-2 type transport system ATP-binding protein